MFPGTLLSQEGLSLFQNDVKNNKYRFLDSELVVISNKKNIDQEFRVFVVNKQIVTGCQYMTNHKIDLIDSLPDSVYSFVNELINQWTPAESFVIDIAKTYQGLRVIEVNCINSAGPYISDMKLVVEALLNLTNKY